MKTAFHGGGCCGVTHIFGFGPTPDDSYWLTSIKKTTYGARFAEIMKAANIGMLYEVALTDKQMMEWAPTLKLAGFTPVRRFRNSNSGNFVTLLTMCKSRVRKAPPYDWDKLPSPKSLVTKVLEAVTGD